MTGATVVRSRSSIVMILVTGVTVVLTVMALDEYWDLPARLLGAAPTPTRHVEFLSEALLAIALAIALAVASRRLGAREHHLRELLTMCSWCRRVSLSGHWMPIEQFLQQHDRLRTSTSLCPDCFARFNDRT